jgi:signal transduction histidine kinase
MKSFGIKLKLIILFIILKVLPLILLTYFAIDGIKMAGDTFVNSLQENFKHNKELLKKTADQAIDDSIQALDKTSQESIERLTVTMANQIASFLYERDDDILFLSTLKPSNKLFNDFFHSKQKKIIVNPSYKYDDKSNTWILEQKKSIIDDRIITPLKENSRNFSFFDFQKISKVSLPIYKEITFIDLEGKEIYKKSSINKKLLNISNMKQTFVKAENYFSKIKNLKEGEIYVSDVIGEYVGTKVLGEFTKPKAKKVGIKFEPEKYGYGGRENPLGKRFDGLIRFVIPYFKNGDKTGYITLALDHRHIMEFSDSLYPKKREIFREISDASDGNYAFINDYSYRMISHPKDYHITGFDSKTGERIAPWVSEDIVKNFEESSSTDMNQFLKTYPKFENQSRDKKPNMEQLLKYGQVPLDCRYLNFAPQCASLKDVTKEGGYGSFILFFSNVWKLTTSASIPYFTGQYGTTKVGFGTFGIGANVADFHEAANKTKDNLDTILVKEEKVLLGYLNDGKKDIESNIQYIINELTFMTSILILIIIFIAISLANYLTKKIDNLVQASKKLANGDFSIVFKDKANDEIGKLEQSFESSAETIKHLLNDKNDLNKSLNEKVRVRTKELETAKVKAEDATNAKSIFLANMSHEIRTPINGIVGMIHLIEKTNLTHKQKHYIEIINSSSNTLLSVINDILDFSKIEAGKLTIDKVEFNLKTLIDNLTNIINLKVEEKGLIFNVSYNKNVEYLLFGDSLRISQVLINLINNAIKFTNQGSVKLIISHQKDNVMFEIKDTGIGLSKDNQMKLFHSFNQADSTTTRKYGGTGLGLSISKQLVELMDGSIWVNSEIDKGSTFGFEIPLLKVENFNEIKIEKRLTIDDLDILAGSKILLVEDIFINQEIILGLLEESKINIDIANNGLEAINMFKNDYDLILMDIQMPIMGGIEATKIIRKSNSIVPIIALSANVMKSDIEETKKAGTNDHINKPIDFHELYKTLLQYINR